MSIRSELRANWQAKYGKPMTSHERICYMEAKEMIEEFLIPLFREMAENRPFSRKFFVSFINEGNGLYYFTIHPEEDLKFSQYSDSVVLQAAKLAKDYGIDAILEEDKYTFELDIS